VLLVIVALLCVATVPATGGDLRRLLEVHLRSTWAAFAAIAVQIAITSFPAGLPLLHDALHLVSYGLAAVFLVANRRVPGLWVMAAGGALNLVAIAANGGVMPASRAALAVAGIAPADGFANSAAVAHPRLLVLGDVIGVPGPWPIGNVLSVGDLVLFAGLLVLLHRVCGGAIRRRRRAKAPGCAAR
jgi:hypothetical protein